MNLEEETQKIIEELEKTTVLIASEEMTLKDLGENAKSIQINTKRLRNLWRNRDASQARDAAFQKAIEGIATVIGAFKHRFTQMEKGSSSERDLASEIGDYCGVQGGIFRDWGKFDEAAKAYGEGHKHAKLVRELGGKSNSYCLVQELINLVLARPSDLNSADVLETKLRPALSEIRQSDRKGDPWAQADQALITQLVDPQKATEEWDILDDLLPKPDVYAATRDVVIALAKCLRPQLDGATLKSWNELVARLQ
jgi:hypothetical protein